MRKLTDRQRDVLNAIKAHITEHGVPPSRSELARTLQLSHASAVTDHLARLADKGLIEVIPGTTRGIRVIEQHVPLVGPVAEVAAGTPIVCEAHILEHVPAAIAEQFHPRPDYLLTVRGDSIDLTGITDGSVVAVRKTAEAKSGQLVVARFGDEVTLKRFVRIDERRVELRPESRNPAHKTLELDLAKHILDVDGVVVGALITGLDDTESATRTKSQEQQHGTPHDSDDGAC